MSVEQITPNVRRAEQGFDYSVAGVHYYFGEVEDGPPVLLVRNKTLSPPFEPVDNPELVLSWRRVDHSDRIDEQRTVEYDEKDNVVAVVFDRSRDGVSFDNLPLPEDVISRGRELMTAYHGDSGSL